MNASTEKIIDEARRLLEKWGNREAARRRLSQAIQANPNDAELWYWMARALDTRSHAVDALRRALKADPTHRDAKRYLEWLEQGIGDASEWTIGVGLPEEVRPPTLAPTEPATESPPSAPRQQETEDILAWLNDSPTPATSPATPSEEPASQGSTINLDWLLEEGEVAPLPTEEQQAQAKPAPEPSATDESWSFLAELAGDEVAPSAPPTPAPMPQAAAPVEEHGWSFLDELETGSSAGSVAEPGRVAEEPPTPLTEESLWHRADQILGPVPGHLAATATPQPVVPPRGAFTFQDVPPSPAAALPVRNSLLPLTITQVEEALAAPAATPATPARKESKGKAERGAREEKPKREKAPRRGGIGRLLVPLLLLVLVLGGAWVALRNDLIPEGVKEANPAVATQIATLQDRLSPAPTPLPRPDWIAAAETARYENRVQEAEEILREGLANEPDSVAGLVALSDFLRYRPGREGEALTVAEQAVVAATTVDERAWASEAFVWAMAVQPQPDLGRSLASAEQALTESPRSPHAHWARAMAATLEGNADLVRDQSSQAMRLAEPPTPAGIWDARQAELEVRLNNLEQARQFYEKSLESADYVPWRVALVLVLRQLQTPDALANAEFHLGHLQGIAPDDPAVQALGQ